MATGRVSDRDWGVGRWLAPPRFLLFFACAAGATTLFAQRADLRHALLGGFDLGSVVFLCSLWPLSRISAAATMRREAAANDANRALLLLLVALIMLAVLGALAVELAAKQAPSLPAIGLIIATLLCSWLFTNSIFALHYAHIYYRVGPGGADAGGITFPGTAEPFFWEFAYFAFCLGMTFQTSDTDITSTRVRKVATLHAMMAFIFSIGVIAFTINVLGSSGASTVAARH